VGDIVNTASRIQALNKALGTRLLASEAALADLPEFATRPLGSFLMAGKTHAVAVVEVLGSAQDAHVDEVSNVLASFADALRAYRAGQCGEARELFATILATVPDDGPSRFYVARCDWLLRHPSDDVWTPTIRVDHN
jgi:adenylate cyclase